MISPASTRGATKGSVLVIVLWVAFGLVSLALYFGQSMGFNLRASDNQAAGLEAEQAIEGAARYAGYLLTKLDEPGQIPDPLTYQREGVRVGDATFWFIGRSDQQQLSSSTQPIFGLVDEASKLNLNTATQAMLENLPRMTPELAAAIIDWRDADSEVTSGGAESETYLRLQPAYACKNGPFETLEELRLVKGADLDILYGEDANMNGVLDRNENDGTLSLPNDNRDGRLDPGILEYLTVYSREPNTRTNVNDRTQLAALLQQYFSTDRSNQILAQFGGAGGGPGGGGGAGGGPGRGGGAGGGAGQTMGSILEFYIRSKMTPDEFSKIESSITVTNTPFLEGLVNVNTASEAVLACIPGIGTEKASTVAAFRQSNATRLNSVAWLSEALNESDALLAGPYVTGRSYQFTADIAALGHFGRGYRRKRFIVDTSEGAPKILFRQDLSHLGWALGTDLKQRIYLANATAR